MSTRAAQVLSRDLDLYAQFWDIVREGQEVTVPELKQGLTFTVLENTPGYLPENDDPATFDTFDAAWDYLQEEVRGYVEHLLEVQLDAKVHTDKDSGWVRVEDGGPGRDFYINHNEGGCEL